MNAIKRFQTMKTIKCLLSLAGFMLVLSLFLYADEGRSKPREIPPGYPQGMIFKNKVRTCELPKFHLPCLAMTYEFYESENRKRMVLPIKDALPDDATDEQRQKAAPEFMKKLSPSVPELLKTADFLYSREAGYVAFFVKGMALVGDGPLERYF